MAPLSQSPPRLALPCLATASSPRPPTTRRLPLSGVLYDPISISNFVDLDSRSLTASLSKTFRSSLLTDITSVALPVRLSLGARLGLASTALGVSYAPLAKASLAVRLLDVGGDGDTGFVRARAGAKSDGRASWGFEVDRKVALVGLTSVYGNILYGTKLGAKGAWTSVSSVGLHQKFRWAGFRFAASVGVTPEGKFVSDIKF